MKEHFEKFLGAGNVSDNENDLVAYAYDASEQQGKARLVVWPEQDEHLRLILTFCNRGNLDCVIRGNASNQNGMTIPHNSIVINTQGFDRIHALNVNEQWVKVDCGVTLANLNEALKQHGYRYPLEPDNNKLVTVGGWLAMNGAARQSQLYGRAIDTVKELEVMDGTGKSFIVTKDFQDYLGFEGTIFFIIRAKLKIIPITPRTADIYYFDTVQEVLQEMRDREQDKPLSLEFLDSIAATYAGFNTKHALIVEWEGEKGTIAHEQYLALMQKLENSRKMLGMQGYVLMEDAAAPDKLEEAIDWCRQHELPLTGHLGLGILHPFAKREQDQLRHDWISWIVEQKQKPVGAWGYGSRKKVHVPLAMKAKLRTLKERYDYNNILGRGKLHEYV